MRTIHKFKLETTDDIQVFSLPNAHSILKFGEQDGQIVTWIDLRTGETLEVLRKFHIIGTGHDIGDYPAAWLDTVQMSSGLVWHIYEKF